MLASFFGSSSPSRRAVAEAVPVRVNVPASGRLFPLAKVGLSVVDELSPGVDAIDCKPAKLGDASLTEWNPEGVSVWTGVLETPRALTDPGVLIDPGVPTPDCAISSSNWTPGIGPLGRGLRARTCHRRAVFSQKKWSKPQSPGLSDALRLRAAEEEHAGQPAGGPPAAGVANVLPSGK